MICHASPCFTLCCYASSWHLHVAQDHLHLAVVTVLIRLGCPSTGVSTTEPGQSSVPEPQQQEREAITNIGSNGIVDVVAAAPLDFRILTEPVAMRPNKSAYGVPYDLVDTSQESAMSEMLQQVREADTALAAVHLVNQSPQSEG